MSSWGVLVFTLVNCMYINSGDVAKLKLAYYRPFTMEHVPLLQSHLPIDHVTACILLYKASV